MPLMMFVYMLCGVIVGILANYLADVLPRHRRLTKPVCLECGENRQVEEFLTGKPCRHCGKKNAIRYWSVILATTMLSIAAGVLPAGKMPFIAAEILLLIFSVMVITDIEFRVILEQVSGAGYVAAALTGWFINGFMKTILGGICGFLIFLGLYYLGKVFARRMSRNREVPVDEEALGFGDVNLAGVIGLLTGFPYVLPALLCAVILGGLASGVIIIVSLINKRYEAFQAIPYGPFIILGGILVLYFYH